MGNSNVIAEVGLSVVNVLKKHMTPEPIASPESIGLCMPQDPEDFQITVWIYSIEEQKSGASSMGFHLDPVDPGIERYSPMQLKVFMLVTAHSKAPSQVRAADEYRIMGRALQTMRDTPVIEKEYLEGSLAGDDMGLNAEMYKLSTEELTKIWNNASKPVKLSFGLSVTVSLESERVRPVGARINEAYINIKQKN